jgi:hypothetical protein
MDPSLHSARGKAGRRILLVATMRDEGPFVLEWVAYHLATGFTDVVICSNDCVDESPALLGRLQELGFVTHLVNDCGPGDKPQLAAYARAERLPVVRDADWAMVLDADEFLNVHVGGGRVTDLLDAVPHATAFLINWRVFGSSEHRRWKPGFVTERFTRAACRDHGVNLPFKTLFTRIDAYQCKLLPHQPRYPQAARMPELRYVNGSGVELPPYFHDESRADFLQAEPGLVSWELAQVNHYNTRSREDHAVKHRRGGGLNIAWEREASWAIFDRNEETDLSIRGKLAAARALYERLLEDDGVRRCHARCCELYREHAARLARGADPRVAEAAAPA